MPKVYRVETVERRGMYYSYCNGFTSIAVDDRMRHPVPADDSKLCRNLKAHTGYEIFDRNLHYFGFTSIEQLKRWIYMDEWRVGLDRMGYSVSVYETPVVIEGDTQAIFELHNPETTRVERLLLTSI